MEFDVMQVVKKIPFDVRIWKKTRKKINNEDKEDSELNHLELLFNNKIQNTTNEQNNNNNSIDNVISVKRYINEFSVKYTTKLKKFIKGKLNRMEFDTVTDSIILEYLETDIFFEIRYPKSEIEYILASTSSKIRNPLTNIVGLLPLIQSYNLNDKKFQQYVNLIKNSCVSIISVANDLVDILDYKKGYIIIKKEEIHLNEFLSNCIEIFKNSVDNKKVLLTYNICETGTIDLQNVPSIIYTDKNKLKQIIINLLSNAVKFTEFGHIIIEVSLCDKNITDHKTNSNFTNLLFKIKDSGIGIDINKQDLVDSILGLNNKKLQNSYMLSGFGLYISNFLCNSLNTNLQYKTGAGTTFFFNIICEYKDD